MNFWKTVFDLPPSFLENYIADFFMIDMVAYMQGGLKFHGGPPKKSSRSDQPLPNNLLNTNSPLLMPILKFAAKHQCPALGICPKKRPFYGEADRLSDSEHGTPPKIIISI